MTGLKQALNKESSKGHARRFRIEEILETLDDDDKQALTEALADLTIKPIWIMRALKNHGIHVSDNAICNYRAWFNVPK